MSASDPLPGAPDSPEVRELQESVEERPLPDLGTSIQLARRAQQGEREALNRLLERYQDRLQRIVRIRLGARLGQCVDPVDIVQETFLVAVRKLGELELRNHASILQWLATIAEHKIHDARDYHFAQRRDRRREQPLARGPRADSSAGSVQFPAADTAPGTRAWKNEIRQIMDDAMVELPDDYREVILLHDYSGADWDHIHQLLGRESKHACQELHRRAWIRLRRIVMGRLGSERGPA